MSAWDRLDTENDLFVLTGLLLEWLEHLKTPALGKDAITYVVIHCDDVELAMSKVCLEKLMICFRFPIFFLRDVTKLELICLSCFI